MAGYTTTVNAVPSTFAYDRRLLDRLVNSFIYIGFGEEKSLKANMGAQISFRRYTNLTAATTALTEGVTPAGSSMAKTDYNCTVAQYGDYVTYTDWVDMVGVDANIIKIIDDLQADQAADTLDQKMRAILDAATNVVWANTDGTPLDSEINTILDKADLNYVQNQLERNNVKYLTERTKPGVQINTSGLDPGYIMICHPDVRADLEAISEADGFTPRRKYPADAKLAHPNEFGTFKRIKCIATTNAYVSPSTGGTGTACKETNGTNADVYYSVIFGKGAFGNVRLDGGALKTIVKPLGYKDPLNQEGSVGWKATFAGLILDQTRIWKIVHGVSA